MWKTLTFFSVLAAYPGAAQTTIAANTGAVTPASPSSAITIPPSPPAQGPLDYVCPMDSDVRSDKPGVCPRCGMTLRLGIPDMAEFPLDLKLSPSAPKPGEDVQLTFAIRDPKDGSVVKKFEIVHEKLFHMFIVSSDLKYFLHDHPVAQPDGTFIFHEVFPKAGMFRVVADVFPSSGSPQLITSTVFVNGTANEPISLQNADLPPDTGVQHGTNTDVEVKLVPPLPVAGTKTLVFFKFKQADGMQKYLGAWAHMLIASDDTIDLIHEHPFIADGGQEMQFNIIFPRSRTYRVWLQFQRNGVVNTVAVNIPVLDLETAAARGINP